MRIPHNFRLVAALLAIALLFAFPSSRATAQGPQEFREISGKVVDSHHQPVKGAIVKIENEASEAIMSFVTDADGSFHFKRVSANDDFRVWASFNGVSSKKHVVSKFNSKETPFLTLELR